MNVFQINGKTGETVVRELTTAELAEHDRQAQKAVKLHEIANQKLATKMSARDKLTALGLTDEEIAALVGG